MQRMTRATARLIMDTPMLKHLVARYRVDTELLKKHPEHKELLERRIERHKNDIVAYVTSDNFQCALNHLNL